MCRVFEEVKNEGIRIGEIRGKEIGREQARLDGIRAIMSSLDLSLSQAMEVLKIPIELREKYSEKWAANNLYVQNRTGAMPVRFLT